MALQILAMYSIIHPGFHMQGWHIFVSYLLSTWLCCLTVLFGNRALPVIGNLGGIFSSVGFLISTVVCATMPHVNKSPYASNAFVWTEMENTTGWSNSGFVFCLGMLNGAFAVGAPDIPSHLAEEIPRYCYSEAVLEEILTQGVHDLLTISIGQALTYPKPFSCNTSSRSSLL